MMERFGRIPNLFSYFPFAKLKSVAKHKVPTLKAWPKAKGFSVDEVFELILTNLA